MTHLPSPPTPANQTASVNMPDEQESRQVSSRLECAVTQRAEIVLSVATAHPPGQPPFGPHWRHEETCAITVDQVPVDFRIVEAENGTRLHLLPDVPPGRLVVEYQCQVSGRQPPPPVERARQDAARVLYLRPSRYCESDALAAVANHEFAGLSGRALLDGVSSWVGWQLSYVSGSSRLTDGAINTYLARQGVCRDFAHLVIALLRARGVPARLTSVYAPGLAPMDFHAVAEAQLDDHWYVVDATALAPRAAMVRIATGRDASDTAFLTVHAGRVDLLAMEVSATMNPRIPRDDMTELVQLG